MSTSLAQQLSNIASQSTHSLNLKAQKASHSQSLIFDRGTAATQDFSTIYALCTEGFEELCKLDRRFATFRTTIFSEESKAQDRTQMTAAENDELNRVLEDFLGLVGARLLLKPAVKAVEWLVRRFRVHEYNLTCVLLTFLPYHTTPLFRTLLAILPSALPHSFRFLRPYITSMANPPRHAIVYSVVINHEFTSAFNNYVLNVCKAGKKHHALLTFWAGTMAEAVSGTLDLARSGRKGVQNRNEQDILIRLLPVLNEGLTFTKVPELRLGCYMVLIVLATKAKLDDQVLTAMMEAVVVGWTKETASDGFVCLTLLAEAKESAVLPRQLLKKILSTHNITSTFKSLSQQYRVGKLVLSLIVGITEYLEVLGDSQNMDFIERMLDPSILTEVQMASAITSLLLVAQSFGKKAVDKVGAEAGTRNQLANLLIRLQNSVVSRNATTKALQKSGVDIETLELELQTALQVKSNFSKETITEKEISDAASASEVPDALEAALSHLPTRTVDEISFLSERPSHLFVGLLNAFLIAVASPAGLQKFSAVPLLRQDSAVQEPLFFSFFIRIWCGPNPAAARSAALRVVDQTVRHHGNVLTDFQGILPYLIVALADSAKTVRQAAAKVLLTCSKLYEGGRKEQQNIRRLQPWGLNDLYGNSEKSREVKWMGPEVARAVIADVLVPGLEECTLDGTRISNVVQTALMDSSNNKANGLDTQAPSLKSTYRGALLSFLASHAMNTPLLNVKLGLIGILNQVSKAGKVKGIEELLPLIHQWVSQDRSKLAEQCHAEQVRLNDLDDVIFGAVTHRSRESLAILQAVVDEDARRERPDLAISALKRLSKLWPSLKQDIQISISQSLLKLTLSLAHSNSKYQALQGEARNLLHTLKLSPDILADFVNQLPTAEQLLDRPTPAKRRRLNHDQAARLNSSNSGAAAKAIEEVTFVLELIDSVKPAAHPALIKALFSTLAELQLHKSQGGSELAYLQSLVLSSLLAMVNDLKGASRGGIDFAILRIDLLVDCIRSTASQQVQNAALLLVARLAEIAPDLILHSVMPIFTFISSTVFRQSDDYSVYVIDQTIHRVIPPLVKSLRKRNQDPVTGTADLLLSFTAAFKHVPTHRRLQLFMSLIQTLGENEFLFALLSMLADKYRENSVVEAFAIDLAGQYGLQTQLTTISKMLDLVSDVLSPTRALSRVLLSSTDGSGQDSADTALSLLSLMKKILSSDAVISKVATSPDWAAPTSEAQLALSDLFEKLLKFEEKIENEERVHTGCVGVMNSLLGLLSTKQFMICIETLLDGSSELHWKILRTLKSRLDNISLAERDLVDTMVGFLPRLSHTLGNASLVLLKHAAIACLDTIVEKYGKRDTEGAVAAVHIVAGSDGLGHSDQRVQIISLLCLTSAVETLGPETIPLLPGALSIALQHLETSLAGGNEMTNLHNAVFSFLSALIVHVPWILTANHLDRIMSLSHKSAEAGLDESANQNRLHVLRLIVRQVAAQELFAVIKRTMTDAITVGPMATEEHLDILRIGVEKHPKSTIIKHAQVLVDTLLEAFDLRRAHTLIKLANFNNASVTEIENAAFSLAVKIILKMNDTTFRPMFAKIIEWASVGLSKRDQRGKVLRLTTIFGLLSEFFANLKSIVTSYASYIIEHAVDALTNMSLHDQESKRLWAMILHTLRTCYEHDQDGFWQAPSHFNAIHTTLLSQLRHAPIMPVIEEVVPAVTELAAAVESGDHHKDMNAVILRHMRSDEPEVRLAAIKCEEALTEKLGEEWLALLPEMLPFISELQEDDDEAVESETHRWIVQMEGILGESLESMLQ